MRRPGIPAPSLTLPTAHTVTQFGTRLYRLRDLRKVRVYLRPRTITLVTYYRDRQTAGRQQYQGRAYIFTYTAWKGTTVALAHTSHLPPPTQTMSPEADAESDPVRPPAFGCHAPRLVH